MELEEERKRRRSETELLARKLAEKSSQVEALTQQTLDAENEVKVLKRKNAASLKELTRELQSCKRSLDERQQQQQSTPASVSVSAVSPISRSSRASSNTSLNRLEPVQPGQEGQSHNNNNNNGGGAVPHKSYSGANLLAVQETNGLPTPSFRATEVLI